MASKKSYYDNGQIEYEWSILNRVFHGNQRNWFLNGNPRHQNLMFKGQVNGVEKFWNEDGSRKTIEQFKTNIRHGIQITFFIK